MEGLAVDAVQGEPRQYRFRGQVSHRPIKRAHRERGAFWKLFINRGSFLST